MPMVGLSKAPSGFALTQVMLKSYVRVVGAASEARENTRSSTDKMGKKDSEIAIMDWSTLSMTLNFV